MARAGPDHGRRKVTTDHVQITFILMLGSTRPNASKEANLVHVQEIYRALGKAGSEKEPDHKTHTSKQSQSKSRRD